MRKKIFYFLFILIIASDLFAEWICPKCQTQNKDEYKFCSNCGAPNSNPKNLTDDNEIIIDKTECLNCNKIYSKKWKYCPYCGAVNYFYKDLKQDEIFVWGRGKVVEPKNKIFEKPKEETIKPYLLKSLILPGLGQYELKKEVKGIGLAIISWGTLLSGVYFKKKADDEYDKYNSIPTIKINYESLNHYKDKTEDYNDKSKVLFTISAISWIYNLFDLRFEFNKYMLEKKRFEIEFQNNTLKIEKKF